MFAGQSRARTGVLEHLLQIAAGYPESWKQAEDHGGGDRNENSPAQCLAVDAKGTEERQSHGPLM